VSKIFLKKYKFQTRLVKLLPRKIKAEVNTGVSLIECLREIDEREANTEKVDCYGIDECVKFIVEHS
jgi:hypothetical protein